MYKSDFACTLEDIRSKFNLPRRRTAEVWVNGILRKIRDRLAISILLEIYQPKKDHEIENVVDIFAEMKSQDLVTAFIYEQMKDSNFDSTYFDGLRNMFKEGGIWSRNSTVK